jgi:hypothetical protein
MDNSFGNVYVVQFLDFLHHDSPADVCLVQLFALIHHPVDIGPAHSQQRLEVMNPKLVERRRQITQKVFIQPAYEQISK